MILKITPSLEKAVPKGAAFFVIEEPVSHFNSAKIINTGFDELAEQFSVE